ncbi:transcriptional regulator [Bermanella marisrubri]|nr:transcriptional regulator [Bermanella marisrubri]QIZ84297.1 transcriptional regulator [Bermanella marisrubri]
MKDVLPQQIVDQTLEWLGRAAKQARLDQNHTQTEQAEKAEISLRAAQKIEAGESGQTAVLFRYLDSLDLLDALMSGVPDPDALTPLEEYELKKHKPKRPQRVSRKRSSFKGSNKNASKEPVWGDELVDKTGDEADD